MRYLLICIMLALGVAALASCAKTVHSVHWYEHHKSAMDAMLNQCENAHFNGAATSPDCTPAFKAHHAIEKIENAEFRASLAKKYERLLNPNPIPGTPQSRKIPPGHASAHGG